MRIARCLSMLLIGASMLHAKRSPPPHPDSVTEAGVVYAADEAMPGFVTATDSASGALLWRLQVYVLVYDPALEKDVQDVHIDRLGVRGGRLEVANERGFRYEVDLRAKSVTVKRGTRVVTNRPARPPRPPDSAK